MGGHCISKRATVRPGVAAAGMVVLFTLIAIGVNAGRLAGTDQALMLLAERGPSGVAWWITRLGDTATRFAIAGLAALVLFVARDGVGAAFIAVTVLGGAMFNTALKSLFARPRPDLLPSLDLVHSSSFPSGHAAGALVLAGALAVVAIRHGARMQWMWALAALTAGAVGVSRVMLAVHWPSDVVAGWCAGGVWLILCAGLLARLDGTRSVRLG